MTSINCGASSRGRPVDRPVLPTSVSTSANRNVIRFNVIRLLRRSVALATLLLIGVISFVPPVSAAELDLAKHRGKVVLVDFWASWCEPCRHSFPWLNEMQAKYGERLVVIGVNVDRERVAAEQFLKQVPANFAVVFDPNGQLAEQYDVMGMPSSFVFDPSGTLVEQHIGFKQSLRAEREAQLRKLFQPAPLQSRNAP